GIGSRACSERPRVSLEQPSAALGSPTSRRARSPPRRRSGTTSLDAAGGFDNDWEAVGPVMAIAREAADPLAFPAHHQPVTVMLDFVDPQRAGRWPGHLRRLVRFDEAGGPPRLQDHWPEDRAAVSRFNLAKHGSIRASMLAVPSRVSQRGTQGR